MYFLLNLHLGDYKLLEKLYVYIRIQKLTPNEVFEVFDVLKKAINTEITDKSNFQVSFSKICFAKNFFMTCQHIKFLSRTRLCGLKKLF